MKDKTISFIGCGRMAEAIIGGILKAGLIAPENIMASDVAQEQLEAAAKLYKIRTTLNNQEAVDRSQIVVLAVKPQNMKKVLQGLKISGKLVVSIAAGITIEFLEKHLPQCRVVRTMPNTAVLAGAGMTAVTASKKAGEEEVQLIMQIFRAVGEAVKVPERLMDAVTGLSGSGPGFVCLTIESFIEAGLALGLDRKTAEKLTLQTFLGTVQTLNHTKKSPEIIREMVTSPNGTTHEGLKALEENKYRETIIKAVAAAARRSHELSKEWK